MGQTQRMPEFVHEGRVGMGVQPPPVGRDPVQTDVHRAGQNLAGVDIERRRPGKGPGLRVVNDNAGICRGRGDKIDAGRVFPGIHCHLRQPLAIVRQARDVDGDRPARCDREREVDRNAPVHFGQLCDHLVQREDVCRRLDGIGPRLAAEGRDVEEVAPRCGGGEFYRGETVAKCRCHVLVDGNLRAAAVHQAQDRVIDASRRPAGAEGGEDIALPGDKIDGDPVGIRRAGQAARKILPDLQRIGGSDPGGGVGRFGHIGKRHRCPSHALWPERVAAPMAVPDLGLPAVPPGGTQAVATLTRSALGTAVLPRPGQRTGPLPSFGPSPDAA